jgi:uncharacterized protein with NRDE domain
MLDATATSAWTKVKVYVETLYTLFSNEVKTRKPSSLVVCCCYLQSLARIGSRASESLPRTGTVVALNYFQPYSSRTTDEIEDMFNNVLYLK